MKTVKLFSAVIVACIAVSATSCGLGCNKKATTQIVMLEDADIPVAFDISSGRVSVFKDSMQTVTATFESPGEEMLYGRLVPEQSPANVRFNQIIMPDAKTDGPFGGEIVYDLAEAGTYTISIGESLMQGDPYSGNVTVELYAGIKVPYELASGYFVRNDVDTSEVRTLKIASEEELKALFGMATTMKSKPTPIDFSKQFAIAVVGKLTDTATEYKVSALIKKDNTTTLAYRVVTGEKQSYTIRPCLILVVDKKFDSELRVVEPLK